MAAGWGYRLPLVHWFQSPSRGGHLRGVVLERAITNRHICFSPLHEGDTSVAMASLASATTRHSVSVPFTRGTPPWHRLPAARRCHSTCFSPLHEGDTSVASHNWLAARWYSSFSPLHEGDTSVAGGCAGAWRCCCSVSVPFTRGTPPWQALPAEATQRTLRFSPLHEGDTSVASRKQAYVLLHDRFQSPSRGGHLRGL